MKTNQATTPISPVFPDQPHAAHFQTQGEQVTPTTGVIKKANENSWLVFHVPTRRPIDGFYMSRDSAVNMARHWSKQGRRLEDRVWRCYLQPRGDGQCPTLRW